MHSKQQVLSKLSHTELHHLPHTKRSRSSPLDHAFEFADLWTNLRTHESIFDPEPSTHWSTNPRTRAFDFIGDPEPSRHEPTNWSLSLSLWFWFSMWFWSTHKPTSLWSLIFLLLLWWCGWWCFGVFPIVWWWVLCGWWWKIAFSECYQTHENIF